MTLTVLLALFALFVTAPLCWFVVLKSWRVYRANRNPVALVAFVGFLALAVIVTVFAMVFNSNDLREPLFSGDETRLITRSALAAAIIPPAWWLWFYR